MKLSQLQKIDLFQAIALEVEAQLGSGHNLHIEPVWKKAIEAIETTPNQAAEGKGSAEGVTTRR